MPKYMVTYVSSNAIVIEAEDESDAREKFFNDEAIADYAIDELNQQPVEVTDVTEYDDDDEW